MWIDWQFSERKSTSFKAMWKDRNGALWDVLLGMCWLVIAHSCSSLDVNCQLISISLLCILNEEEKWEVGNVEKRKRFVLWAEERESRFPPITVSFLSVNTCVLRSLSNISQQEKKAQEEEGRGKYAVCLLGSSGFIKTIFHYTFKLDNSCTQ